MRGVADIGSGLMLRQAEAIARLIYQGRILLRGQAERVARPRDHVTRKAAGGAGDRARRRRHAGRHSRARHRRRDITRRPHIEAARSIIGGIIGAGEALRDRFLLRWHRVKRAEAFDPAAAARSDASAGAAITPPAAWESTFSLEGWGALKAEHWPPAAHCALEA